LESTFSGSPNDWKEEEIDLPSSQRRQFQRRQFQKELTIYQFKLE